MPRCARTEHARFRLFGIAKRPLRARTGRLNQLGRDRAAVDRYKGFFVALRVLVDSFGEQCLACTGLALDRDRDIKLCSALSTLNQLVHDRRLKRDRVEIGVRPLTELRSLAQ